MGSDYILSLLLIDQSTFSRWTAHHNIKPLCCLAADYPFPFVHQFRFYHITSHYLYHKLYYYTCLVEIALGCSRNLMIYSKRFTLTFWPKYLYLSKDFSNLFLTSYPSQYCLSLTYHSSSDIFTTINRSGLYSPDYSKITRFRV